MRMRLRVLAMILMIFCPVTAQADLVRMDYTGTVTSATGVFNDEVVPSGLVTGSFFIDTGFINTNPSINQDEYDPRLPSPSALNSVWEFTVSYGTEFHTTANNQRELNKLHHKLLISDLENNPSGPDDQLQYGTSLDLGLGDDDGGIRIGGDDLVSTGPASTPGNLSFNFLNTIAMNTVADFFPNHSGFYTVNDVNHLPIGTLEWDRITLTANLVSVTAVPTPSALLLMGSGLIGLVGWRWWTTKTT